MWFWLSTEACAAISIPAFLIVPLIFMSRSFCRPEFASIGKREAWNLKVMEFDSNRK